MWKIENLRHNFHLFMSEDENYIIRRIHSTFSGMKLKLVTAKREHLTTRLFRVPRWRKFVNCEGNLERARKTKSIFQFSSIFHDFLSFHQSHYERNFPVEKKINVSDSSSNFHVYFYIFYYSVFFLPLLLLPFVIQIFLF